MFLDARHVADGTLLEADVCIIGAGMAGLTIALEFNRRGIHSLVLESGGFRPDDRTRDLYRGYSNGIPYLFADGCRSRFLGGSSNCWGGWCRPMQEHDFEVRPWVPNSGWPFSLSELRPFYPRAHGILHLGPERYDTAFWTDAIGRHDTRQFPLSGTHIADAASQFSPPVRMGRTYRRELRDSKTVTVCLHANVVDIDTEPDARTVTGIHVRTLSGRSMRAVAKTFVLATGGIENARLLLTSNRVARAGLGNAHDLVGRYFMDHPRVTSGTVVFNNAWQRHKLYDHKFHYQNDTVAAHGTRVAAQFHTTLAAQREEGLLNSQAWFASVFPGENTPAADALIRFKHRLQGKEKQGFSVTGDLLTLAGSPLNSLGFIAARLFQPSALIKRVTMQAIVEPTPDPTSRVTLSDQRDELGMPRVRVDWRLDEQVKRTFDRTFALLAAELERIGVATVVLDPPIEGRDWPASFEREGSWHHMGTTRMHDSPRHGVVDRNCLVHGMTNLYIAGSSVFPTAGANYPSITLVALALRLADRLVCELREPEARMTPPGPIRESMPLARLREPS